RLSDPTLTAALIRALPTVACETVDIAAMRRLCLLLADESISLENANSLVKMLSLLHRFDRFKALDDLL
ncbi:hypothetical protein LI294_24755, partial [bacterium 210702-DFI.5.13]|nr:hypothetical protein [bacterium 210702-DFI.5.13]